MNISKTLVLFVAALSITAVARAGAGCSACSAGMAKYDLASKNIVETALEAGSFNTLITAVQAADLVPVLAGKGPYTVFAPSDKAFAALPEGTLEMLLKPENKSKLAAILTYHVVPGKVMAKDVKSGMIATANGQPLDVKAEYGKVMVGGAQVVSADIMATNGVIHVVDSVILPPETVALKK